jgi:hypothetical protein
MALPQFIPPLKVHLCWSRQSRAARAIALELYAFLNRPPEDDPIARPGVGIPVEIGRDLAALRDALQGGLEPAVGRRVIVPILDAGGYADSGFRTAVRAALEASGDAAHAFVPVLLDRRWRRDLTVGVDELAGVTHDRDYSDVSLRRWRLGSDVALAVGRSLPSSPPRLRVFISHTKADLTATAKLAVRLRDHFEDKTRVDVFFDENDVETGQWLVDQLDEAASQGVLLVVRTDAYSDSPWCGLELVRSKLARVPIVTVVSTVHGETRTSAYGGNHRTVVWRDGLDWEVVGRCVQAWLHHHHFLALGKAALARAGLPENSLILSRCPELFDLSDDARRLVVYPDPPMPEHEASVLRRHRPKVRLATPATMVGRVLLAQDPAPPLAGAKVVFSLSDDSELPEIGKVGVGSGLTRLHLRDALATIVLATIQAGARIAYGGDFRPGGFADRLSRFLRSHARLGVNVRPPAPASAGAAAKRAERPLLDCYLDRGRRPGDELRVDYEPIEVVPPPGADGYDDAMRSLLWHLAMRLVSSASTTARILLGGKTAPKGGPAGSAGYSGPWPGLLEEAWRTVEAGNGLFVVGGFGGCAGAIADMLQTGEVPESFQHASHAGNRSHCTEVDAFATVRVQLAQQRGADPNLLLVQDGRALQVDDLARVLLDRWNAFCAGDPNAWPNGLSVAENERLFRTTDPVEIMHLVFAGLRASTRRPPEAGARWRAFRGDLATVTGVDGYAVATTPGVPPVGASVSLDRRMSGHLSEQVAAMGAGEVVRAVAVASAELAGEVVLLANLPLPAGGDVGVSRAAVQAIAQQIAAECDRLGVTSLALPPLGTTLGLSVAESVGALRSGIAAAKGLAVVTLCEVDADRYEEACGALPPGFERLPEGGAPDALPKHDFVLIATTRVERPQSRCELKLYHERLGTTVPTGELALAASTHASFAARAESIVAVRQRGDALWQALPVPIRAALEQRPDRALSLVVDELASMLPWEAIWCAGQATPWAVQNGVTRRLAVRSHAAMVVDPLASVRRMPVRVVVVSNPTGDLAGAEAEATAVLHLLGQRDDVRCEHLAGSAATVDAVERLLATHFDVLHYAGHAFFDPAARDTSGLELAGGVLTAAHLPAGAVPRLVVLGACQSARVRDRAGHDVDDPRPARWSLAEGLLRAGVRALIGTFHVVSDAAARDFSEKLYEGLVGGRELGSAVRLARAGLFDAGRPDWANFQLYGDDGLVL